MAGTFILPTKSGFTGKSIRGLQLESVWEAISRALSFSDSLVRDGKRHVPNPPHVNDVTLSISAQVSGDVDQIQRLCAILRIRNGSGYHLPLRQ